MRRTRSLRTVLIATTVAGLSLPHLMAGEIAGSVPTLILGLVVGLSCLRVALMARTRGGRALAAIGTALTAIAPLIAYLVQETAERAPGLEAAHAEPTLLATILSQAPSIVLAFVAVRLLVGAVRTVVGILSRRLPHPTRGPQASLGPTSPGSLLRPPVALFSSNGQRAPPFDYRPYRLAPLS